MYQTRRHFSLGLCRYSVFLALLLVLCGVVGQNPQLCPEEPQRKALLSLYEASGGFQWINAAGWNSSQACRQPLYLRNQSVLGGIELPSFCCWSGVDCCLSIHDNDNYTACGQFQCDCVVGTVTSLSLGRNKLTGRLQDILSATVLEGLACSVRLLFFGGNDLTGTLPPELSLLEHLRILSLSSNSLKGSIPTQLSKLAHLEELQLSNNELTGNVPPQLCNGTGRLSKLRDLTLSNNMLTGNLDLPNCESLICLDVQNNMLSGPFPDITSYNQLHILRMGNNRFNGTISLDEFDVRLMMVLDLSNNKFSGPLPTLVGNSSQLTIVRLFNNSFTGNISSDIFTVGTLSTFLAYNNALTGTLPENIGGARGISALSLRGNNIYGTLPASLVQLVPNIGSVDLSMTLMSCCGYDYVPGKGYRHFNFNAPRLPPFLRPSNLARPVMDTDMNLSNMRCPFVQIDSKYTGNEFVSWGLDPEYYLYEGCSCLEGYNAVWTSHVDGVPSMGPSLRCAQTKQPWYAVYPWGVVLVVFGSLLMPLWLTYLMCFRRGKNAAIVRACFNIKKRIQGEPVGGQVSIVVTDIEGYSDLMQQSPELMTKALNLHNAIVRKARWNNFGYTIEQEGDSFSLVFHEAHDAVVFCLQTQLSLNRQTWPEGLFAADAREQAKARRSQAPSLMNAISVMTNNLTQSLFGGRVSNPDQAGEERLSSLMGAASVVRGNNTSSDGRLASSQDSIAGAALGHGQETSANCSLSPSVLLAAQKGHPLLFNGLRVRMGIATGMLPPGSGCKGSAVMDMAKMVSDMANGGQIMIDEATFKSIKERMEEFGAVDHNGMNFKQLNSIKPPWYACFKRKHLRNPDYALLLDMGEYLHCPGCKQLPLFQLDATPVAGDTPRTGGTLQPPATPRRRGKGYEPVRVYQILPPALVARAKVLGNAVVLKDEWYCSDAAYFTAPGTLEAPLGPTDGAMDRPQITMAFAIVEGGKAFATRYRRDVRRVNDVAAACIRACLRVVAGGYLCRLQDGDLKYMVAFATPEAAVEWALLLQDVLMYVDWPESALKHWKEECDSRGRLIFRGPRMKIGLCEGSPRSIIPDHIGRADYHGASVNQAARFMDAAAHGGMIALEESLAIKVMDMWREKAAVAEAAAATRMNTANTGAAARNALSLDDGRKGGMSALPSSVSATAEASALLSAAAVTSSGSSSAAHSAGRAGNSCYAGGLSSGGPYDGSGADHTACSAPSMTISTPRSSSRGGCSRKGQKMAAVQEVGQEAETADSVQELSLQNGALLESRRGASPPPRAAIQAEPSSVCPSAALRAGVCGDGRRDCFVESAAASADIASPAAAGPVAEAAECDGATNASGPSSSTAAMIASVVGNGGAGSGSGGGGGSCSVTVALGAVPAHSTLSVESGPSMTGLASASAAGLEVGTSTVTVSPRLLPHGSSYAEPLPPAAEVNMTPALPQRPSGPSQSCGCGPFGLRPLRSLTGTTASAAAAAAASAAIHTTLHSSSGTHTHNRTHHHVSFSQERTPALNSHPYPTPSLEPSCSPSAAGFIPRRTASTAAGCRQPSDSSAEITFDSIQVSAGIAVANAIPAVDTPSSSIRFPRPPSLTPLALPSEQERDAALCTERELAEAARKVRVDGPVDARYSAHVLAFRIGLFRFKGSPEPVPMAHVVLEHLAERRFPSEGPKGKGAKVGDASGLLDECHTSLPDLASLLQERYMLLLHNPGHCGRPGSAGGVGLFDTAQSALLDVNRSSPSNHRLRAFLASRSMGASPISPGKSATAEAAAAAALAASSDSLSPRRSRASGARTLWKSRSVAGRVGGGGGGGNSGTPSMSDSGCAIPKAPRGPNLVSHLASFAASSVRWIVGSSGVEGVSVRQNDAISVPSATSGGEVTALQLELPMTTAAARRHSSSSADGSNAAAIVTSAEQPAGLVGLTLADDLGRDDSKSGFSVQGGNHKDARDCGLHQAKGNEPGSGRGGGGGGSSSSTSSIDPRVRRPSPLRYMSGRDDAVPEGHLGTANAVAAVAATRGAPHSTGDTGNLASGEERV